MLQGAPLTDMDLPGPALTTRLEEEVCRKKNEHLWKLCTAAEYDFLNGAPTFM